MRVFSDVPMFGFFYSDALGEELIFLRFPRNMVHSRKGNNAVCLISSATHHFEKDELVGSTPTLEEVLATFFGDESVEELSFDPIIMDLVIPHDHPFRRQAFPFGHFGAT